MREKKNLFADFRAVTQITLSNADNELDAQKLVLGLMKYQHNYMQGQIERMEKGIQEVEESRQRLVDGHKGLLDLVSKKKTEEGGAAPSKST